jgi:hypothetical protein
VLLVVKSFRIAACHQELQCGGSRSGKQEELKWEPEGKLPSPLPYFLFFNFFSEENNDGTIIVLMSSSSLALQVQKMMTNNIMQKVPRKKTIATSFCDNIINHETKYCFRKYLFHAHYIMLEILIQINEGIAKFFTLMLKGPSE